MTTTKPSGRRRALLWVDWFAAAMLLLATGANWWHAEYGSAVFTGGCAGFVLGIASVRALDWYLWRDYP